MEAKSREVSIIRGGGQTANVQDKQRSVEEEASGGKLSEEASAAKASECIKPDSKPVNPVGRGRRPGQRNRLPVEENQSNRVHQTKNPVGRGRRPGQR